MPITTQKPMRRVGVGAMYICFHDENQGEDGVLKFEGDVTRLKTVASIQTTEEGSTDSVYGSNEVYDTDASPTPPTLAVEALAFPPAVLAKMRGNKVTGGFVTHNTYDEGRGFAFGIAYPKKNGKMRFVWHPNCKLTSITDAAQTKDSKGPNTQNPEATIQTKVFNDAGDFQIDYDTELLSAEEAGSAVKEDAFFAKPLLTPAVSA